MSSAAAGGDVEAGFAKLQGEDFEYYMQTYSIVLGRNSKKSTVDVDLSSLGGGMNISRHHARIFYDFARRRFALEVLGKNGCLVEGVLHLPGNPPVKLDSQDLLQIGDKEFYFLLPVRSILGGPVGPRHYPNHPAPPGPVVPHYNYHLSSGPGPVKKAPRREYYEEEFDDEDDVGARKMRREGYDGYGYSGGKSSLSAPMDKKSEGRSRVDRDADNLQLQQLEEKDVVSSVATVLSDLCGPGEWMPMEKLHAELLEQYSSVWHHSRVRRYLTSEDWPGPESKGKPWYGLLMLLRKYPEHFVINTRSKGRVTLEFVSLVSLLS
ncbi:FHA domain-containing protein FHA2 [Vigna radiata var. radiata]|uniref:FHA domain-containing protein FHA2 n=1 Tax=Vigna radiata var. radiata TaxID=3916 RepID=A0A1S3TWF0_VIGRR|nr:FHA domain-containing protein FHA2 [Vigna radiata var. radiata]